jgi:hypothetical protein
MTDGSVCRKICGRQTEFGQNIFQTSHKKQNNCFIQTLQEGCLCRPLQICLFKSLSSKKLGRHGQIFVLIG